MSKFDPTEASPADFDQHIAALEKQLAEQTAAAERTRDRLQWFRDGRQLFAGDGAADGQDAEAKADPNSRVVGLARESFNGKKPNLRQAILVLMLERPPEHGRELEWPAKDVIVGLEREGWMPSGSNAENIVRNMLRDMAKRTQLDRPNYGTYRLTRKMREGRIDAGA